MSSIYMRQQQLYVTTAPTWPGRGTELDQDWPRKDNKNKIINLTERNGRWVVAVEPRGGRMDSLKEERPQHFNSRNFYENARCPASAGFLFVLSSFFYFFFLSHAHGTAAAENKNKGLISRGSRGYGGNGAARVRGQMHENLTSPWHLTCHLSYSYSLPLSELENFSFSRVFPSLLRLTANSDNILKSLSGREECIFIE